MYRSESWTIKKTEHQRIDAFKLWWWKRLLRDPYTGRRSNQSVLKEINPECSLGGLMLKLQYFGHLMWRTNSFEKTLMLGTTEGGRKTGWQRRRWFDGIIDSKDMNLCKLWEMVKDREAWHAAVHGVKKSRTWLSNWTTTHYCHGEQDSIQTLMMECTCGKGLAVFFFLSVTMIIFYFLN